MAPMLLALCACLAVAVEQPGPKSIDTLCTEFGNFDRNGDGQIEIARLNPIASAGDRGDRVLLLVEHRLLNPLEGVTEISPLLERWASDLQAEGCQANVIAVELAKSDMHQDGQFVLALREFLRAVEKEQSLAGVVLVGHFPDSSIVRVCNWRKRGNILRRHPELVAKRADIVLADLDGRWEDVYVQPKTRVESVQAQFEAKIPRRGGPCKEVGRRFVNHEDVFYLSDGAVEINERLDAEGNPVGPTLLIRDEVGDYELSDEDNALPNGLAQPEIFVSRLDARGVALQPRKDIEGVDGSKLLDAEGNPQAVKFTSKKEVPRWDRVWEADPILERRLLAEYFDRNHAYRTGVATIAWRPSSIACDLGSGYRVMSRAAENWDEPNRTLGDLRGRPTLVNFAEWMQYPAVLRTVRAHSDPMQSMFKRTDTSKLDAGLDGPAWSWTQHDDRLEPSLASACGRGALNWFLLRSLWENGKVASEPCFYHHTGCNGISPYGAESYAYDHPRYGLRQGAEALLLFGNGLALVGRSKVYYDEPSGFVESLRDGQTFGKAWSEYFRLESQAGRKILPGTSVDRKKAYYWSVLGDWTLKLSTAAPKVAKTL